MTRVCPHCGASIEHRSALAKSCEICADVLRNDRSVKRRAAVREAYRATAPQAPVVGKRQCQFPGCTRPTRTNCERSIWCAECRNAMIGSRRLRAIGRAARIAANKEQELRVHNAHRVQRKIGADTDSTREPQIVCTECYGMPWARTSERRNSRSGDCAALGPPVADERGVCRGCGLPWEPEPRPELCGTVRSSAGMAVDHGAIDGFNRDWRGRAPDGKRKKAK